MNIFFLISAVLLITSETAVEHEQSARDPPADAEQGTRPKAPGKGPGSALIDQIFREIGNCRLKRSPCGRGVKGSRNQGIRRPALMTSKQAVAETLTVLGGVLLTFLYLLGTAQ